MATQAIAASAANSNGSLILALHARYEQAWAEYNRLDEAKTTAPVEPGAPAAGAWRTTWQLEDGMKESAQESDLIRLSLLWQVPSTFEEATVLAYHLWSLFDPEGDLPPEERKAIDVGMTSLFDFLICEGGASAEKIGAMFSNGARLAYGRRRRRTGFLED